MEGLLHQPRPEWTRKPSRSLAHRATSHRPLHRHDPLQPDRQDRTSGLWQALHRYRRRRQHARPSRHVQPCPGSDSGSRQDPADRSAAAERRPPLRRACRQPVRRRPGWLPEIWALGFRHPQNLSFDPPPACSTIPISAKPTSRRSTLSCAAGITVGRSAKARSSPTATTKPSSTRCPRTMHQRLHLSRGPVRSQRGLYHSGQPVVKGSIAITGGFVYRPTGIPGPCWALHLRRHGERPDLSCAGQRAPARQPGHHQGADPDPQRRPKTLQQIVGTTGRVDLRFGLSENGSIYVMTKQDGKIRRLVAT